MDLLQRLLLGLSLTGIVFILSFLLCCCKWVYEMLKEDDLNER